MTDSDRSTALAQLLDGTISEAEAEHLLERFRMQPDLLNDAADQFCIHQLLQAVTSRQEFAARIQSSIGASSASASNIRRLESAVMKGVARGGTRQRLRTRLLPARSGHSFAVAALVGFVMLAALLLYVLSTPKTSGPSVAALSGEVRTGDSSQLQPGAMLHEGALIRTHSGTITLKYADGTVINVESGSVVCFRQSDGSKKIELQSGALAASVTPQPERRPLTVSTANASAVVVGTRFRVSFASSATELHVHEGAVTLQRTGDAESVLVKAGFWSVAREGHALLALPQTQDKPLIFELEDFGNAAGARQANGPTRQIYRERPPLGQTPSGGWAIAVPGDGTAISGDIVLPPVPHRLWICWRDENRGIVAFDVMANGKRIGSVKGSGKSTDWKWSAFEFDSTGSVTITLRSTTEGHAVSEDKLTKGSGVHGPQHPYDVVNRWDQMQITSDLQYRPDK